MLSASGPEERVEDEEGLGSFLVRARCSERREVGPLSIGSRR
jgi:hypothetical protein